MDCDDDDEEKFSLYDDSDDDFFMSRLQINFSQLLQTLMQPVFEAMMLSEDHLNTTIIIFLTDRNFAFNSSVLFLLPLKKIFS